MASTLSNGDCLGRLGEIDSLGLIFTFLGHVDSLGLIPTLFSYIDCLLVIDGDSGCNGGLVIVYCCGGCDYWAGGYEDEVGDGFGVILNRLGCVGWGGVNWRSMDRRSIGWWGISGRSISGRGICW